MQLVFVCEVITCSQLNVQLLPGVQFGVHDEAPENCCVLTKHLEKNIYYGLNIIFPTNLIHIFTKYMEIPVM